MKKKRKLEWKTKTSKKEFLSELVSGNEEATPYQKENNFELGEYIEHPNFGVGFVFNVLSKTKIEVFFVDSEKVLLQNWA